jgi:hypothetical protein
VIEAASTWFLVLGWESQGERLGVSPPSAISAVSFNRKPSQSHLAISTALLPLEGEGGRRPVEGALQGR